MDSRRIRPSGMSGASARVTSSLLRPAACEPMDAVSLPRQQREVRCSGQRHGSSVRTDYLWACSGTLISRSCRGCSFDAAARECPALMEESWRSSHRCGPALEEAQHAGSRIGRRQLLSHLACGQSLEAGVTQASAVPASLGTTSSSSLNKCGVRCSGCARAVASKRHLVGASAGRAARATC